MSSRGGARDGAGRPKGEETVMVRVPKGCVEQVRALISVYKKTGELPVFDAVQGDFHEPVHTCSHCDSELFGDGITTFRHCPNVGRFDISFFKPADEPLYCCQCSNPDSRRYCVQCHPWWGFGDPNCDPSSFDVPLR